MNRGWRPLDGCPVCRMYEQELEANTERIRAGTKPPIHRLQPTSAYGLPLCYEEVSLTDRGPSCILRAVSRLPSPGGFQLLEAPTSRGEPVGA